MIHETTTPSGIAIAFEDGLPDETGKSKQRRYLINGSEQFTAVTTALGILDKPALKFWSQKIGVAGAIELAKAGELPMHVDGALSRMKSQGLQFWQVSNRAADRGTLAHEDLIALATGGEVRDLASYTDEEQGYIRGVSSWYADVRPKVLSTETMVASLEYRFAGRYDLRVEIDGRVGIVDLKTSEKIPRFKDGSFKPPYDEHLLQVAAYDLAAEESGYGASDFQAVLRVEQSGEVDFTETWAEREHFLAVLQAHRMLKELGAAKPARVAA